LVDWRGYCTLPVNDLPVNELLNAPNTRKSELIRDLNLRKVEHLQTRPIQTE